MAEGVVKFFNQTKGFGTIKDRDSGEETIFFNTGLVDDVSEGDFVTYEVEEGKRGPNAVQIRAK